MADVRATQWRPHDTRRCTSGSQRQTQSHERRQPRVTCRSTSGSQWQKQWPAQAAALQQVAANGRRQSHTVAATQYAPLHERQPATASNEPCRRQPRGTQPWQTSEPHSGGHTIRAAARAAANGRHRAMKKAAATCHVPLHERQPMTDTVASAGGSPAAGGCNERRPTEDTIATQREQRRNAVVAR